MSAAKLIKQLGWHEFLSKTNFSFLAGASHPDELVARAGELGYASFCVNDFDGGYGLARTYLKSKDTGVKINYGMELHLQKDHAKPILLQDTLVLLATSYRGYFQLNQISTLAHRDGKLDPYLSLAELLQQDISDLVAIQPMRGAMRAEAIDHERLAQIYDAFGENFYFALSRHLHPAEDIWLGRTYRTAKKYGGRMLFSQDAFMHHPKRKPLSDVLHTIRTNKDIYSNSDHFFANGERSLHSLKALGQLIEAVPEYEKCLRNAHELNERCQFSLSEVKYEYPKENIPEGYTAQAYLEKMTWQGARERFGDNLPEKMIHTITHELDLIEKLEFADYFLTVWDIVAWARSQGILCQGRGSAANSSVCFVLGITAVNPTLFYLLFERFLSMERGDPPDIDVDFEHERREEVVQYIYQRYGRARAAMVANVVTYRGKGSLRAVGKAFGIHDEILGRVSKLVSSKLFRGKNSATILHETKTRLSEYFDETSLQQIPWRLWGQLADQLKGFPRHLSIHSGGFVIFQKELSWLTGQEPATMPGRTIIQWCKEDIEGLGIFKIDVLSLGMLTALRKAFAEVNDKYNQNLTLYSLPHDDAPTYTMIQRADTVGTFQIESRAQMSMLPRLKPKCFYDLVIEVAIIRPGPIQGGVIHPYLRRRDGIDPITFPDERLRPILSRTLGIAIFQEQAMRIAIAVGNFTPGEANELRKNIGAWNMTGFEQKLGPWLKKLEAGMRTNGLKQKFIEQVLGQMRGFAEYGFPESHAVSFALLAYASCYLKCHYPAAFFASILNSQPMGFYSPHALLQAAKRAGVQVLPVCVNNSDYDHKLERVSRPGRPLYFGIRLGLRLVNHLSQPAAEKIVSRRKSLARPYHDLAELIVETKLYRDDLTALAAANALSSFDLTRSEAIWQSAAAPLRELLEVPETKVDWQPESNLEKLDRDFKSFNTSLDAHPAAIVKKEHWQFVIKLDRLIPSKKFGKVVAGRVIEVFGMILIKQAPPTAKGMVFITLEDEFGFINLAFTPQVYEKYFRQVEEYAFLCVQGVMQKAGEGHSIMVKKVYKQVRPSGEVIHVDHHLPGDDPERNQAGSQRGRQRHHQSATVQPASQSQLPKELPQPRSYH